MTIYSTDLLATDDSGLFTIRPDAEIVCLSLEKAQQRTGLPPVRFRRASDGLMRKGYAKGGAAR